MLPSVVGWWVLPDENHPEALTALERLKDEEAFAPSFALVRGAESAARERAPLTDHADADGAEPRSGIAAAS